MNGSKNRLALICRAFVSAATTFVVVGCLNSYQESDSSPSDEPSCRDVLEEIAAEKRQLQQCASDSDCGASEGKGTCGCTRALAIRNDADPTRYRELIDRAISCDLPVGGGTCDCPKADGFRCDNAVCTWNYVSP